MRIYSEADPSKVYFDNTITFENGKTYSLFLGGDTAAVAKVFVVESENLYSLVSDSTYKVRFLNIAKNSPAAVNVTLSTSPGTNEFAGVPYLSITPLKTHGTTSADPFSRTFQVRDASNPSTVMASGSVNNSSANYGNNVGAATVIFRGVVGETTMGVTMLFD